MLLAQLQPYLIVQHVALLPVETWQITSQVSDYLLQHGVFLGLPTASVSCLVEETFIFVNTIRNGLSVSPQKFDSCLAYQRGARERQ
jgi:hypothetical protein